MMSIRCWMLVALASLLASTAGCNPGQPGPELRDAADQKIRRFVAAVQSGNQDEARKLYHDPESVAGDFKDVKLEFVDSINMGTTMDFRMKYKASLPDGSSNRYHFTLTKTKGGGIDLPIKKIEVYHDSPSTQTKVGSAK